MTLFVTLVVVMVSVFGLVRYYRKNRSDDEPPIKKNETEGRPKKRKRRNKRKNNFQSDSDVMIDILSKGSPTQIKILFSILNFL